MRPRRPPSAPTLPGVRISGEGGQRGTIGVDRVEEMRRSARVGEPIASIARHVGVSEPTVRKYARMVDLSPEPPSVRQPESEVLTPYEGTIDPGSAITAGTSACKPHRDAALREAAGWGRLPRRLPGGPALREAPQGGDGTRAGAARLPGPPTARLTRGQVPSGLQRGKPRGGPQRGNRGQSI